MKKLNKNQILSAAVATLFVASLGAKTVRAQEGEAAAPAADAHKAEKHSCKGKKHGKKDKKSCAGKKDKKSCSGKDGCGGKADEHKADEHKAE